MSVTVQLTEKEQLEKDLDLMERMLISEEIARNNINDLIKEIYLKIFSIKKKLSHL